jgi:hypothetical protein
VLLYEMVTARLPFAGKTVGELYDSIRTGGYTRPSAWNPAVPATIENAIARCLEKKPAQRFQSAAELMQALDGAPAPRPVAAAASAPAPALDRRKLLVGGGAAVALAAIGAVAYAVFGGHGPTPPPGGVKGPLKDVTVETMGGSAEVWRNGQLVGTTTYHVQAAPGAHIELELRRPGFQPLPVAFDVTERNVYSYTLQPARE